jgi:hypothetical protein
MKQREPGFFYGINAFDVVKIAGAFMLSLAGFYLIWRTMFGPPLFEPSAIQAQLRKMQTNQQPAGPAIGQRQTPVNQAPVNQETPGEVTVGIAPSRSGPNR